VSAETAPGQPIIQFDHVTKTFAGRSGKVVAVNDVSLTINAGEIFGVIGYSGAGKSTLVRLINALEHADSGRIEVHGREVTGLSERELNAMRADVGMIFQQFNLFSARTVAANVAYPLRLAGWPKEKRIARTRELLDFVGIADKASAWPQQLSGGQKQRVGIARALAASPSILLADEATSALDPNTTHEVLDLLRRVNQELGVTLVVITHNLSVVQYICDRVAVMDGGTVVEEGPTAEVFAAPQSAVTRQFVDSGLRVRAPHASRLALVQLPDGDAEAEAVMGQMRKAGLHVTDLHPPQRTDAEAAR